MTEKTAVTAGPWKLYSGSRGVWSESGVAICTMHGPRVPKDNDGRHSANAKFIVALANAAFEINPDHHEKVAAEIVEAFKRLHEIRDAFKAAALEVTSWNVGGGSDLPPWPWHEEWFSRVDALLSRLGATNG